MDEQWRPDVLGTGFSAQTLLLPDDFEGAVVATLIRYEQHPGRPLPLFRHLERNRKRRVVLYLHGWSDYFFQSELAQYFASEDVDFYALDLRKYGRSILPHHTRGYTDDLSVYDEDIAAAWAAIEVDQRERHASRSYSRAIFAHSTGGLIAALWTRRHPDVIDALMMNSAWLETHGSQLGRSIATPALSALRLRSGLTTLPNVDLGFSKRLVSAEEEGEWHYNELWRPTPSFPVRAGWLAAVLAGHEEVDKGLGLPVPVLAMASARSHFATHFTEEMRGADVVLDADLISRAALHVGDCVTVRRFEGGLHDLVLSAHPVRDAVYRAVSTWCHGYWPA